jgi:hypothetical protein
MNLKYMWDYLVWFAKTGSLTDAATLAGRQDRDRIADDAAKATIKAGGSNAEAEKTRQMVQGAYNSADQSSVLDGWLKNWGGEFGLNATWMAVLIVVAIFFFWGNDKKGDRPIIGVLLVVAVLWYWTQKDNKKGSELPDLRGVPGTPVPGANLAYNPVLMSVGGQDLRESDLKELGWSDEEIEQTWYGADGGDETAQES